MYDYERLVYAINIFGYTVEIVTCLEYLQLPIIKGHDCQSIGKLLNIIGHFALIVSLD